jgi:molybdate transport system ATP-binding protein
VDAEVRRGEFRLKVAFRVAPGEVLGVLGPNGAGKSTLLRALAGLTPVSAGSIRLGGQAIDDAASGVFVPAADRPVGFVFQNYRLFPHLTVLDNVAFGAHAQGRRKSQARQAAHEWINRLGLADLAVRKPAALSGGQAQRVALARALARQPALLLLDEPLAALDARTRLEVQSELREHLADFPGPCLLVTHDPVDALVLADRLLVLEDGRIVQQGTPSAITKRPTTEYVAKLVGLNLYPGHAGHTGQARVAIAGGGTFVVADHAPRGDVLVAVRPSAVLVSAHRIEGASARNSWPGQIAGLTLLADRVRLDIHGQPPVVADVTPAAVAELSLAPGSPVWMTVKATDLEVYGRESAAADPLVSS